MPGKLQRESIGLIGMCRVARGLCIPVLMASLLAACAGGPFAGSRSEDSLFGNYLAGRHAAANRENKIAADYYAKALSEDPGNPIIVQRAFLLATASGDMSRARSFAESIVDVTPSDRTARLLLALSDAKSGDYDEAIANIDAAAPGPFTALIGTLVKAWAQAGKGDADAAVAQLESFADRPAFDLFRHYHEALILDYLNRPERAAQAYEAASQASGGGSLRIVQAYGRFLERTGNRDDANRLFAEYAAQSPNHPIIEAALARIAEDRPTSPLVAEPSAGIAEALYGLGSALAQDNGNDIALLYLQLAVYMEDDFDVAHTLMADLYERGGRWTEAIAAYAKVDANSPLYKNAQIQIAIDLDRLDKRAEATRRLERLADSYPDDLEPLTALADLVRGHEDYAGAADIYSRVIEKIADPQPRHWSIYYARGICYERTARWSLAEEDLKFALKLSDNHPLVLNYLGYSWVDQGRNLGPAMEMIRQAVDLRPNDGFIVDSLGWAHYRLGEFEQAVEYLERAVELQPDDPTINDHLGDALWQVGRRIEARFQWRHALELKPEEDQVAIIREKLEFGLTAPKTIAAPESKPANGS